MSDGTEVQPSLVDQILDVFFERLGANTDVGPRTVEQLSQVRSSRALTKASAILSAVQSAAGEHE